MTKKRVRFTMDVQLEQLNLFLTHTKNAITFLTSRNAPHRALIPKEQERIAHLNSSKTGKCPNLSNALERIDLRRCRA